MMNSARMRLLTFCLLILAGQTSAQSPLPPSEFGALVEGKTFDFGYVGHAPYGIERYLPDNTVIWSWGDGQCEAGTWYTEEQSICFVYDFDPGPHCWMYFADGPNILAILTQDDTGGVYQLSPIKRELVCDNYGL